MSDQKKDVIAAPASAQPDDAHCKWPMCQSEEVQQQVADQVYRELYSGAQPDRGAAQERDALAKAIHDAAVKAGIIHAGAALTGPKLVMLCNDLAAASTASQPVAPEPIYQVRFEQTWSWHDATEDAFHTFMPERRRIVYTAPAAVAPSDAKGNAAAINADGLPPGIDYEGDDGTVAAYRSGELIWHANVYANDASVNEVEMAKLIAATLNVSAPAEKAAGQIAMPECMPDAVRTVIARFSRAVEGGQCILFNDLYADIRAALEGDRAAAADAGGQQP